MKVWPAMVSDAERADEPVLAATEKLDVPEPVPDVPVVIVTQDTPLDAVHAQPAVVVTATEPAPPSPANDRLVGEIEYEHGVAACVTVRVEPAIVRVPVRLTVAGFAATL